MHSSILVLVAAFASVMASPQSAVSSPASVSSPLPPTTPISSPPSISTRPSGTRTSRPVGSVIKTIYIPKTTATGLPLGAECNRKVVGSCANGVECYATNVLLKPRCGNYKSRCTTDAQCAYHHCVRDMCQGFKKANTTRPSTSGLATGRPVPTSPSGSGANSSATLSRTGSTPTGTGPAQANEVARVGGSLAGLLALAALVALAL